MCCQIILSDCKINDKFFYLQTFSAKMMKKAFFAAKTKKNGKKFGG